MSSCEVFGPKILLERENQIPKTPERECSQTGTFPFFVRPNLKCVLRGRLVDFVLNRDFRKQGRARPRDLHTCGIEG
ncbi:hypothetical protein AAHA92_11461 [Salvia divinorum]|uniref:Uncharacterized protein n=1 Tax=Salvia divinorum TaxID=28513 RepID=A0ABD1HH51_SALDI